jgi:hypothetical protein
MSFLPLSRREQRSPLRALWLAGLTTLVLASGRAEAQPAPATVEPLPAELQVAPAPGRRTVSVGGATFCAGTSVEPLRPSYLRASSLRDVISLRQVLAGREAFAFEAPGFRTMGQLACAHASEPATRDWLRAYRQLIVNQTDMDDATIDGLIAAALSTTDRQIRLPCASLQQTPSMAQHEQARARLLRGICENRGVGMPDHRGDLLVRPGGWRAGARGVVAQSRAPGVRGELRERPQPVRHPRVARLGERPLGLRAQQERVRGLRRAGGAHRARTPRAHRDGAARGAWLPVHRARSPRGGAGRHGASGRVGPRRRGVHGTAAHRRAAALGHRDARPQRRAAEGVGRGRGVAARQPPAAHDLRERYAQRLQRLRSVQEPAQRGGRPRGGGGTRWPPPGAGLAALRARRGSPRAWRTPWRTCWPSTRAPGGV